MRAAGTSSDGGGEQTVRAGRGVFPPMRWAVVAVAVTVVLAIYTGSTALAGDKKHNDKGRAHFEMGTAYFRLEKYPDALREFEQGYLEMPDPAYLFNIAKCHSELGRSAEAIRFFRRFLDETRTGHAQRAQAEQALRELEGTTTPATQIAPPPPSGPPSAPLSLAPVAPAAASAAPGPGAPAPAAAIPPGPARLVPLHAEAPITSGTAVSVRAPDAAAATEPGDRRPVYKTWWFWTLVGAAVVGGVVVGVAATSGKTPDCPAARLCL